MHLCIFVFVASFPALSTLEPGCILAASLQDHGQHTATALQHSVFVRVCICISIMILVCIFVTIWDRIWVTTWICICVNTWVYLCVIIWEVCNVEDESIFFVKKKVKNWNGTKLHEATADAKSGDQKRCEHLRKQLSNILYLSNFYLYFSHDVYFNLFHNLYLYLAKRSRWSKKAGSISANSCQTFCIFRNL